MTWHPLLALPARQLTPLFLVVLALITASINYVAQLGEFSGEIEARQRARLLERMSLEQSRLESQLGLRNDFQTRRLVSALGLYEGITHAWLLDAHGRVVGGLARRDQGRPLAKALAWQPDTLRQALLAVVKEPPAGIDIQRIPGEQALIGQVAVHPDHRLLVRLDLAYPLAERLYEGRGGLLRQAGMTLMFAALLAVLLHLLWFRRARRLTATTAAIGAGRLDARAALAGRDELAEIGAAIDSMASDLQKRHSQLQQLASMIEHSPVVAIAWRNLPGWPISFVSDNIRQWGYARHDFLNNKLRYAELIHPEDRPGIEAGVAKHIAQGPDDYRQEYRLRHADGHWMWIDDRTWLSRSADGNVRDIKGVLLDISESKLAEEALRKQEEFFRLIAENIDDFIAVLDLDGRRLYNSPSYRRFFSGERMARGSDSFAEIHPDDRGRIIRIFMDTVRTGAGCQTEFRFILDDGSIREMESSGIAIRDGHGVVTRVLVVSRDVTERKASERAIHELNASLEARVAERTSELQTLNQSLESFVYSVSHDLKTPLRGIEGYSRLLIEDFSDKLAEEGQRFLGNIRAGVARMNELIDDLLDYSRMERRQLAANPIALDTFVANLIEERAADLAAGGVQIVQELPPVQVQADPEGLALVLRNLLENALKFSAHAPQPRIDIGAREVDGGVRVWVKDNGIGFDMKYHDRIFDIFQRLHRLEDYPGTGIGLALVKKAMQRMGGKAWAESRPGEGATFFLAFPIPEPAKLMAASDQ